MHLKVGGRYTVEGDEVRYVELTDFIEQTEEFCGVIYFRNGITADSIWSLDGKHDYRYLHITGMDPLSALAEDAPAVPEEGKKYDKGKPQFSLLIPEFLEEMANILTYGAEKYGRENWKLVEPTTRYVDARLRHALASDREQELAIDPDHGMSHEAAVAVNSMFIWWKKKQKEK